MAPLSAHHACIPPCTPHARLTTTTHPHTRRARILTNPPTHQPSGPCRESYPDPAAPAALREAAPGVDLGFFATLVTNVTADGVMINPPTVQDTGLRVYAAFLAWRRRVVELGAGPGSRGVGAGGA